MPTPEELKAQQEAEAKAKADADAKAKAEAEAGNMIPRDRLNEEIAKRKAVEDQLAKINAAKIEAEKKELESKQEFQKLYETEKAKTAEIESRSKQDKILNALKIEALKKGVNDVSDIKLLDVSQFKVNDSGEVEGIEKAVADLIKSKPYLFAKDKVPVVDTGKAGAGSGMTGLTGEKLWKYLMSHGIEAQKFYNENPTEYERLEQQFGK